MVRINRVHTGTGDGGETSLLDGTRVGKESARVELYGTIDELNSQIGVLRMELARSDSIGVDEIEKLDSSLGLCNRSSLTSVANAPALRSQCQKRFLLSVGSKQTG